MSPPASKPKGGAPRPGTDEQDPDRDGDPRAERAKREKDDAAAARTVTCAACQKVVLERDTELSSYGVLCARCHEEEA